MANRYLSVLMTLLVLFAAGCSYRFVDPFPAGSYALVSVRNATTEAGLAPMLEEPIIYAETHIFYAREPLIG